MKALLSLVLAVCIGLMLSTGIHAQDANAPKGKIAFMRLDGDDPKLFVINADGTDMKPIVTISKRIAYPAWSPDGKQIAYSGFESLSRRAVYVINADGSGEKRITDGNDSNFHPSWSPDGKQILCSRFSYDGATIQTTLRLLNLDGSTAQDIKVDGIGSFSLWSPDGKRLGYAKGASDDLRGTIYLMNADGSGAEQFANSAGLNIAGPGAWSSDGKTLLTTRMDYSTMTAGLWLTDVTSKSENQLSSFGIVRPGTIMDGPIYPTAVWSPDGKWIACAMFENGKGRIHLISRDGQTKKALTPEIDSCFGPTWTK